MQTFGVRQAARILGATAMMISRRGRDVCPPSAPTGFTFADLVALRTVLGLREAGVSLQAVRKVVETMNAHGRSLAGSRLVILGERVHIVDGAGELFDVLSGARSFSFVYDLRPVVAELTAAVKKNTRSERTRQAVAS